MNFLSSLFGYKDPSKKAMPYLDQIPTQTAQYYQPYLDAGTNTLGPLQDQYLQLMKNPGQRLNSIGQDFQHSPGYKFALEQALGASSNAAAANGMAGSPMHQFDAQSTATGLANQDYYNWLSGATGLYGQGLTGGQNLVNLGQNTAMNRADMIANMLGNKANLTYTSGQNRNKFNADLLGAFSKIGAIAFGGFDPATMAAAAGINMPKNGG